MDLTSDVPVRAAAQAVGLPGASTTPVHAIVVATAPSPWLPVAYIGAALVVALAATWGSVVHHRSAREAVTAARDAADAALRSADAATRSNDAASRSADAAHRSADAAERAAAAAEGSMALNAEAARAALDRADAEALSQRYHDAAVQLGHPRSAVRLAGAYAMARLADDWADQRQMCVDVLSGYLRLPSGDALSATPDGEDEVRRAIVDILAGRFRRTTDATTRWPGCSLDLSNAHLSKARFVNCAFEGQLVVSHARFTGFNNYLNCYFGGATHFSGTVIKNGTLIIDAAETRYLIEMIGAVVGVSGLLRIHHAARGGTSRITLSGSAVQPGGTLVIRLPEDIAGNSLRVEGLRLASGSTVVLEPHGDPRLADARLIAGQLRSWVVEGDVAIQASADMRLTGSGFDLRAEVDELGARLHTV